MFICLPFLTFFSFYTSRILEIKIFVMRAKNLQVHLLNLMSKISTVNVRKEAPTACEYNYSSFNCKI